MDETLYYVEGPDGEVLGPMTLMNVLEGVAAGAVLEEARICEVGQSEWVELSDVAYAREASSAPAPTSRPSAPAAPTVASEPPQATGPSAEAPPGDLVLEERWSPAAGSGPEDVTAADEPETSGRHDRPVAVPRWADEIEEWAPSPHRPETAPAPRDSGQSTRSAPVHPPKSPKAATPSLAEASRERDAFAEDLREPVASREEDGEFALEMEQAEEQEPTVRTATERRPRLRFLVPGLVVGAIAIIGGVYGLTSGKLSIPGMKRAPAPLPAPVTAEVPADPVEAGWHALAAGDAAEAFRRLEGAAEVHPDDVRAQHGLGLAALDTGRLDVAGTRLERAAELAPEDAGIHVDLGRLRLRQGQADLAIAEAERARSLDAEEPSALLLLGRAHAAAGRPDEAVKSLAAYVERAPQHPEARRDLARALAAAGRMEPAITEIGPYLDVHPDDREMQLARLDWMLAVGQQSAAVQLYGAAATDRPEDAFAQYLAGTARTGRDDAVTYLRRAVELDPSHRDAWIRLARAEAAIGRNEEAARSLERGFALGPPSGEESKLLATLHTTPADSSPARTTAMAKTERDGRSATPPSQPAGPTLADRVGEIRRALGRENFAAARRAIEDARVQLSGREAERNLALWTAITDFEEGRLESAQKGFESLEPSASYVGFGKGAVSNWLGRVLLARGQVRPAIGVFDQVPTDDPNEYAAAQLWEGIAMSALGMQDLAVRTWGRVREDVGGRVGTTGRAAVSSADFLAGAIAEKDFRTVVSPIPEFENDMYFFLGWAARADSEAARGLFLQSLETSRGREFPWHLAEAEVSGTGLGR